jgi:hypothetical protein
MTVDWLSFWYGVAATLAVLAVLYRIASGD